MLSDAVVAELQTVQVQLPQDLAPVKDAIKRAVLSTAGGQFVYFPVAHRRRQDMARRNAEIAELASQGMPIWRLALRYGLSVRTVSLIVRSAARQRGSVRKP